MKKKFLTTACCAALLSISTIAYSADGPYVSGNLGIGIASDSDVTESGTTGTFESDKGLALGAAFGYGMGNTRIEGEVAYQKNDLNKVSISGIGSASIDGDTSSTALLLNGYYDFKNESALTPFLSAGLGLAKVEVSEITLPGFGPVTSNSDDTVFAYQIGAGVGYAVNDKVSLDLKYRYFATSDPDFEGTEVEYSSQNIYAGVRVNF